MGDQKNVCTSFGAIISYYVLISEQIAFHPGVSTMKFDREPPIRFAVGKVSVAAVGGIIACLCLLARVALFARLPGQPDHGLDRRR